MLTNRFDELNWLTWKKTNENKRISVKYTEQFDYRITNIDAHSRSEAVYKALVTCNSKTTFSSNQISTQLRAIIQNFLEVTGKRTK